VTPQQLRAAVTAALDRGEYESALAALDRLLAVDRGQRSRALASRAARVLAHRSPLLRTVKTYVLRSTTLEPLTAAVAAAGFRYRLWINFVLGAFNQFEQEIAGQGDLPEAAPDAVLLAARLDDLAPGVARRYVGTAPADRRSLASEVVDRIAGWIDGLQERWPEALVLVQGLAVPHRPAYGLADARVADGQRAFVRGLNDAIGLACARARAVFLDLDWVLSRVGYDRALDPRMLASAWQPYSAVGLDAVAAHLARTLAAALTPRRKCLVLDGDNTLWGGVVGEDGPRGIQLGGEHPGSAFTAFQEALCELHDRGVLLALASKNNESDVFEILDRHPGQVLRREHFAAIRVEWSDKARTIAAIAAELNFGLDALVFVDDSPFECELVARLLPEVLTVQAPLEPHRLVDLVADLHCFDVLNVTSEDRDRPRMYQAQAHRERARTASASLDDYLRSLGLQVRLCPTTADEAGRVAQLTQRTNQFNLTTRRYTEPQVHAAIGAPATHVYHAHVRDRFGDQGIVGAVILRGEGSVAQIDTLLLSCRVLGRRVEDAVVGFLIAEAARRGYSTVVGEYRPTERNSQVCDLLARYGFTRAGEHRWRRVTDDPPGHPEWLAVEWPAEAAAGQ
jgi:FkbH-like protein